MVLYPPPERHFDLRSRFRGVHSRNLAKFEGGLNLLHEADDDAGWNPQRLQQ